MGVIRIVKGDIQHLRKKCSNYFRVKPTVLRLKREKKGAELSKHCKGRILR